MDFIFSNNFHEDLITDKVFKIRVMKNLRKKNIDFSKIKKTDILYFYILYIIFVCVCVCVCKKYICILTLCNI